MDIPYYILIGVVALLLAIGTYLAFANVLLKVRSENMVKEQNRDLIRVLKELRKIKKT